MSVTKPKRRLTTGWTTCTIPALSEFGDDDFDALEDSVLSLREDSLATKRRRAEQRLEALRLREELGDYDFDFDDDF